MRHERAGQLLAAERVKLNHASLAKKPEVLGHVFDVIAGLVEEAAEQEIQEGWIINEVHRGVPLPGLWATVAPAAIAIGIACRFPAQASGFRLTRRHR